MSFVFANVLYFFQELISLSLFFSSRQERHHISVLLMMDDEFRSNDDEFGSNKPDEVSVSS